MGDQFISYPGPDGPWAHRIGGLLEANGFSVEIDHWDWPPATDAGAQINGALERADRVLALWSPRYFDPASWAGSELSAAFYMNHVDPGRLVPVLIEACSITPLYKPIVHIDIAGKPESWKESGLGVRHGAGGIRKYARTQALLATRFAPKREIHFFPYSARATNLLDRGVKLFYGRRRS